MTDRVISVAVIGAGAWGTALAHAMASNGIKTRLWGRDNETLVSIRQTRTNPKYLPGIALHEEIEATEALGDALQGATHVLMAVPAQTLGETTQRMRHVDINPATPVISCAKGLDERTGERMSEILHKSLPKNPIAVLSGPSFARDVASGLPTAVTLAAASKANALDICNALSSPRLRLYANDDLCGVEYGGAIKNVLAIAAGIVEGKRLGDSAKAALIARGFAELQRIALAMGGQPQTLAGLSGLGDLILTCGSRESRNFSFGVQIGEHGLSKSPKLVEGAHTAKIAAKIARTNGISAPLVTTVAQILAGEMSVDDAITSLTMRAVKAEND
ncbi:MAG: NAD(P)H-dependent glycerol-3-phosphate dehydrogenase [Pseudomonadota bacterium]